MENPIFNSKEDIYSSDRFKRFEEIKSPSQLLSFMTKNIKYGFVSNTDEKIYSPEIEGWGKGEQPKQKLQNPNELLESGYGTCWEQTELARRWFVNNKYEFKTYLLMFGTEISQKNPAHSILAFKKDDKWFWFESALESYNNIHEFDSLNELLEEVKEILTESALRNKAASDDLESCKIYEYDAPKHNGSTEEFISQIIINNRR